LRDHESLGPGALHGPRLGSHRPPALDRGPGLRPARARPARPAAGPPGRAGYRVVMAGRGPRPPPVARQVRRSHRAGLLQTSPRLDRRLAHLRTLGTGGLTRQSLDERGASFRADETSGPKGLPAQSANFATAFSSHSTPWPGRSGTMIWPSLTSKGSA